MNAYPLDLYITYNAIVSITVATHKAACMRGPVASSPRERMEFKLMNIIPNNWAEHIIAVELTSSETG